MWASISAGSRGMRGPGPDPFSMTHSEGAAAIVPRLLGDCRVTVGRFVTPCPPVGLAFPSEPSPWPEAHGPRASRTGRMSVEVRWAGSRDPALQTVSTARGTPHWTSVPATAGQPSPAAEDQDRLATVRLVANVPWSLSSLGVGEGSAGKRGSG